MRTLLTHRDHASHMAVELSLSGCSSSACRQYLLVRQSCRTERGREHLILLWPSVVPASRVLLHHSPIHALFELCVRFALASGVGTRVAVTHRGLDRGRISRLAESQV